MIEQTDDYRPFAGIGSRETPKTICAMMEQIAIGLSLQGFTCRTGGADGADYAFLKGALHASRRSNGAAPEMFLPWPHFNGQNSIFSVPPTESFTIARKYHPGYDRLPPSVQKLMARNAQQIQGKDLKSNSKFVICWTPDGCISGETRGKRTGGTGQAIAHASALGIPVFNLQRPEHYAHFVDYLRKQGLPWTMTYEEAHADMTPCEPSPSARAWKERRERSRAERTPK